MFFCLRSRSRRAKLKFRSSYRERTVPSQFLRGIICRRRLLRRLCLRSLLKTTNERAEILEIGRVPLKRTFLTDLAIRDTSFITSLKMTAAGVYTMEPSFRDMALDLHNFRAEKTLELTRAFFMSQDGSSLIHCFCEKVTARKNKHFKFFSSQGQCFNIRF